jgi:hypothetical protein
LIKIFSFQSNKKKGWKNRPVILSQIKNKLKLQFNRKNNILGKKKSAMEELFFLKLRKE